MFGDFKSCLDGSIAVNFNNESNLKHLVIIDSIEKLLDSDYQNELVHLINNNRLPCFIKLIITCRSNYFKSKLEPKLESQSYENISLDKSFSILDSNTVNSDLFKDITEKISESLLNRSISLDVSDTICLYYNLLLRHVQTDCIKRIKIENSPTGHVLCMR